MSGIEWPRNVMAYRKTYCAKCAKTSHPVAEDLHAKLLRITEIRILQWGSLTFIGCRNTQTDTMRTVLSECLHLIPHSQPICICAMPAAVLAYTGLYNLIFMSKSWTSSSGPQWNSLVSNTWWNHRLGASTLERNQRTIVMMQWVHARIRSNTCDCAQGIWTSWSNFLLEFVYR